MARSRSTVERAATLHRQAVATADAAAEVLDAYTTGDAVATATARQRLLAGALTDLAAQAAPGWLSMPLDGGGPVPPIGTEAGPAFVVRVGTGTPLPDASFPVLVPLLGHGHLAIDAPARDLRTAALLRALTLRLVAAVTPGALRVRAVDPTGVVFAPFHALHEGRVMPPAVTDLGGLRSVLGEAEQWVRTPAPAGRHLLLIVAGLPGQADAADLARLRALADHGAGARFTMIVTGLPDADLSTAPADARMVDLPDAVTISLRGTSVTVTGRPGSPFGSDGLLNSPVVLDTDPGPDLVDDVCVRVAQQAQLAGTLRLSDLLPELSWQESSGEGLSTVVGLTGHSPLSLRLNDLTPHWLIGGRSGAGKTALLIDVLYGLCARYSPTELTLYLLDFKEGVSFLEFTPTPRDPSWIPHARAVGIESDRAYGLAVLRELDAEMTRRSVLYKEAGVSRFTDLRRSSTIPRILCVIDEFQVLLAGDDRTAREAVALLESIARKGRSYGIHLILSSQTMRGIEALYAKRDSIFGQFPVRIALPGGSDVLDVRNSAASALRLGTAVVNTAGGLGGPSGASRAHERLIDFPDPHADPKVPASLRRRLWHARPAGARPPYIFEGYAPAHLPEKLPLTRRSTVFLGRYIDVEQTLATFPLDATPGRHVAVVGPGEAGAELLDAVARSLARQHKPGRVRFVLAPLVAAADTIGADLATALTGAGHDCAVVDAAGLRTAVADPEATDTYLVGFGIDGLGADLRPLLREGPARRVHLLGWWRGLRRFGEDTGGIGGRDDVAGLVLLGVQGTDAALFIGELDLDWQPRPGRALLHDRHAGRTDVIVPFSREAAG